MTTIGEAADRQMTTHACPARSKGSPSSFPPQLFLFSRRHAHFGDVPATEPGVET
jgi:hypothetical protein